MAVRDKSAPDTLAHSRTCGMRDSRWALLLLVAASWLRLGPFLDASSFIAGHGTRVARLHRRFSVRRCLARETMIIPRPEKGPRPLVKIDGGSRPHVPIGAKRRPGPIRPILFHRSMMETLDQGVDLNGRGGLRGRYNAKIVEHLAERRALVATGVRENITVLWDVERFRLPDAYSADKNYVGPLELMDRTMRWIAGVMDATVTRVEAVEYTRYLQSSELTYRNGEFNIYNTLRQKGAVVHRVWPPMSFETEGVFFERFRHHLDLMANGGPKAIMCVLSDRISGYQSMFEAAQSEGVTVVRVGTQLEAAYYPGGHDFSVPMLFPKWRHFAMRELRSKDLDPFRPDEEWLPEHSPRKWNEGPVNLEPWAPDEELDRRVFHSFLNRSDFDGATSRFLGTWVRRGIRLNDTLQACFERTLNRKGKPGTVKGPPKSNETQAFKRDLAELAELDTQEYAALFWNYESHRLMPAGPPMKELLARVVRWYEGFVGMQIRRVEVAKNTEPWDVPGASAHDWIYQHQKLGSVIHRIWPPSTEGTNRALTATVAAMARAKLLKRWSSSVVDRPPRVVIVLTEDLCFDAAMEDAQDAGITAMWLGADGKGAFYPANSRHRIPIDILEFDQAVLKELAFSNCNPYTPGVYTADHPAPAHLRGTEVSPVDKEWGRPDELQLDGSRSFMSAGNVQDDELAKKDSTIAS
eukprot:TRINITY_DN59837_c0_g1_i1.p1 TRINITY_DN59837_c0_g1~~TRINITY_DN59837_c0_g1_i1.p1  ORF type:complete len:694 (-),score=87.55 TRINITY_DN59837_c0_g1_i1:116-2197(-)